METESRQQTPQLQKTLLLIWDQFCENFGREIDKNQTQFDLNDHYQFHYGVDIFLSLGWIVPYTSPQGKICGYMTTLTAGQFSPSPVFK